MTGRNAGRPSTSREAPLDLVNSGFLLTMHLLAVAAIPYMIFVQFSWWSVGLGLVMFVLSGLAITGGYHRLFSHRSYRAHPFVRAIYLALGAAAVQNSAVKWSSDHRLHHAYVDTDADPYNIEEGFWWAHVGWVLHQAPQDRKACAVNDLMADPLVRFQDRYYVWIAIFFCGLLPLGLGFAWGDPIGAFLIAGCLRLVVEWHATFAINSVAHKIGTRPYSDEMAGRDSWITALLTFGEGYHNFHHTFQGDYRNGIRWYHFDPTKWIVWCMARVGLAHDIRRVDDATIEAAKLVNRPPQKRPPQKTTTTRSVPSLG